eukprot:7222171-Prymnesium_polylepis.2
MRSDLAVVLRAVEVPGLCGDQAIIASRSGVDALFYLKDSRSELLNPIRNPLSVGPPSLRIARKFHTVSCPAASGHPPYM